MIIDKTYFSLQPQMSGSKRIPTGCDVVLCLHLFHFFPFHLHFKIYSNTSLRKGLATPPYLYSFFLPFFLLSFLVALCLSVHLSICLLIVCLHPFSFFVFFYCLLPSVLLSFPPCLPLSVCLSSLSLFLSFFLFFFILFFAPPFYSFSSFFFPSLLYFFL